MGGQYWEFRAPYNPDVVLVLNTHMDDILDELLDWSHITVSVDPRVRDFCTVAPLTVEELVKWFGSTKPTYGHVRMSNGFGDTIERGSGRYIILYQSDSPSEVLFLGYSFD